MEKVLLADNGIQKRHFANPNLEGIFEQDAQQLNEIFESQAPSLASATLNDSLSKSATLATDLDALFVCTCTGYLCPGISSFVAEKLGMRSNVFFFFIVGLGCGALIPTLRAAHNFLHSGSGKQIAVVAVEICSAAFYIDDDPGVLISLCIFGDGCSASIWTRDSKPSIGEISHFDTLHLPKKRNLLRFENRDGKLRNRLHFTIPAISSQAVETLYQRNHTSSIEAMVSHGGGRDVLHAIEKRLPQFDLQSSRNVLSAYGNMSSPSVFFGLEDYLNAHPNSGQLWLTSFGAGFACHGCSFRPTSQSID